MNEFLELSYFNNSIKDYLIAMGIIASGLVVIRLIKRVLLDKLRLWASKTETTLDDYVVSGIERFALPIASFVIIYWGLSYLTFSDKAGRVIEVAIAIVVTFFVLRLVSTTLELAIRSYLVKQEGGDEKVKQLRGMMLIINMVVWTIGLLVLFDNLGYDVTTIIAGLGIGGIAVALAAQNILGDLFNYFVIFLDRPFEIGDFIVVDDKRGTVEHIGVKTTRFKSLNGEQLVLSNSDLTKSRLHNFKRMERRRILFTLSVTYQTTSQQLQEIPQLLRNIVEAQTMTTFDRAHFASYGPYSLNFEVVYFFENPDFNLHMDTQQQINLQIFEAFEKRGIAFAYPTQTVFAEEGRLRTRGTASEAN